MVRHGRGDEPFTAGRVDEVDGGGVQDVGVGVWCPHRDLVSVPDLAQVRDGPGEEVPAGDRDQLLLSGVGQHVRDRGVVLVHVDGGEHHLVGQRAEVMVGVDVLPRHDRADVRAVRVHELQDHDLAAQRGQGQGAPGLVGEREPGRGADRDRGQAHQVDLRVGDAGRDPGLARQLRPAAGVHDGEGRHHRRPGKDHGGQDGPER